MLIPSFSIELAALLRYFELLYCGAEQEGSELLHRCQHAVSQHLGLQKDMRTIVHGKEMVDCFTCLSSCCDDIFKKIGELEACAQQSLTQHPELK